MITHSFQFPSYRIHVAPVVLCALFVGFQARAQVNCWTNPASGNWEDLNWSLGIRPTTNQVVMVTNAGWKAVSISASTTAGFPGALTVHNLEVSAPEGDLNTLLLNYANTAVPLRALDSIVVGSNGILMNISSGVIAGTNGLTVAGGKVVHSGGFVYATNGTSRLDGIYNLTNAALQMERLDVGVYNGGVFSQSGGQVSVNNLNLGAYLQSVSGGYSLQVGTFRSDSTQVGASSFSQSGGTNTTKIVALTGHSYGGPSDYIYLWGSYYLDAGALFADTVLVGNPGVGQFLQSAGTCSLTNAMIIRGVDGYPRALGKVSLYRQSGGTLVAQNVDAQKYARFEQTNGTTFIAGSLAGHGDVTYWGPETLLFLSGGFLGCSNLICDAADFTQTGGTLSVTNLMRFSGIYCGGPDSACSAAYRCTNGNLSANAVEILGRFTFSGSNASIAGPVSFTGTPSSTPVVENSLSGGTFTCQNMASVYRDLVISGSAVTVSNLISISGLIMDFGQPPPAGYASLYINSGSLTASNISVEANMYIHPDTARITNSGTFSLSGYLSVSDGDVTLGRFALKSGALPGSASISLGGNTSRLAFADSSLEKWSGGDNLRVRNWSGSTNGGGDEQLKFGSNSGGLTPSQLAQIIFLDPAGFAPGIYNARILNTGEVVPTTQPSLYPTLAAGKLILNWSNATALQTSTNVMGPFVDVPSATSPYTNTPAGDMQRFFRLRQ